MHTAWIPLCLLLLLWRECESRAAQGCEPATLAVPVSRCHTSLLQVREPSVNTSVCPKAEDIQGHHRGLLWKGSSQTVDNWATKWMGEAWTWESLWEADLKTGQAKWPWPTSSFSRACVERIMCYMPLPMIYCYLSSLLLSWAYLVHTRVLPSNGEFVNKDTELWSVFKSCVYSTPCLFTTESQFFIWYRHRDWEKQMGLLSTLPRAFGKYGSGLRVPNEVFFVLA